jgi:hypothetical protein
MAGMHVHALSLKVSEGRFNSQGLWKGCRSEAAAVAGVPHL